jgi:polyhydroxybutyrate depolymerase
MNYSFFAIGAASLTIFLAGSNSTSFLPFTGLGGAAAQSSQQTTSESKAYAAGNHKESLVTADGRTRSYVLHIPLGYSESKTYPLVLLFHGGGGLAERFLGLTAFDAKADQAGFIVVAPEGLNKHWNDGRGTANINVDDVAFVRQLIGSLQAQLPIDKRRIYATGMSNGGHLTERLGCELSDTFAAIAPDVGPIATELVSSCKPAPISVIGIQGDDDALNPIAGGSQRGGSGFGHGGSVASAAQTMNLWAAADGCNLTPALTHIPATEKDGTKVDQYLYSNCKAGTDVAYYIVQGMGHHWPPTEGFLPLITGATSHNIIATDVFWDFFRKHSR